MNKIKQYLISIDGSTTNTGIAVFDYNTKELIDYTYIKPDNPYETNKNMNKQEENEILRKRVFILSAFPEFLLDYFGVKLWKTSVKHTRNQMSELECRKNWFQKS